MAIVKMKKFTLLTFESKKSELLKEIQGLSNVEFINLQDESTITTLLRHKDRKYYSTLTYSNKEKQLLRLRKHIPCLKSP